MSIALDLDRCVDQLARSDSVEELLSTFKTVMADAGFIVPNCNLLVDSPSKSPCVNTTSKLESGEEAYSEFSTSKRQQVRCLAMCSPMPLGAFDSFGGEGRKIELSPGARMVEGVCIPFRCECGSFAIAFSKIVQNGKQFSIQPPQRVAEFANAFLRKYREVADVSDSVVQLTKREIEVLRFVSLGETKRSIADLLGVTNHAIDFHYRNIMKKYNTSRMIVAVVKAVKEGVI